MAVVLEGSRRLGLELGDQGAGITGAEPSRGGQLPSADRGTVGAEVGAVQQLRTAKLPSSHTGVAPAVR
jgi:hypothetical protein